MSVDEKNRNCAKKQKKNGRKNLGTSAPASLWRDMTSLRGLFESETDIVVKCKSVIFCARFN